MDKDTYLKLYSNTVNEYGKKMKRQLCLTLEKEHKIKFSEQITFDDCPECLFFEKKDYNNILEKTVKDINFLEFFDRYDFIKLYKYSIPFFFKGNVDNKMESILEEGTKLRKHGFKYNENMEYSIANNFNDIVPILYCDGDNYLIKFVFQKSYFKDSGEPVDYRYIVVLYIDTKNKLLEIRYDSLKHCADDSKKIYMKNVNNLLSWIKENLELKLYRCDSIDFLDIIKNDEKGNVKILKQMMEMGSDGAAELTASQDQDFILPFIGEIKQLIDENEDLFNSNIEIKNLLLDYLNEKDVSASYPYVYLLWKNSIVSKSFIVKVTFSYFDNMYVQMQHITGDCTDFRMERMNNAIEYLASSKALIKGTEI